MKTIFKIIIAALLAWVLQQFLPWWIIAIATFAVTATFKSSGFVSFLIGFLAIGLLWLGLAWVIDSSTNAILSDKIAVLFTVGSGQLVLLVTAVVGGLIGGLGGLSGFYFQKIVNND